MRVDRTNELHDLYDKLSIVNTNPLPESTLRRRIKQIIQPFSKDPHEYSEDIKDFLSNFTILWSKLEHGDPTQMVRLELNNLEHALLECNFEDNTKEHLSVILMTIKQRASIIERDNIFHQKAIPKKSIYENDISEEKRVVIMTEQELAVTYKLSPTQMQTLQESTQHLVAQHSSFTTELSSIGDNLTDITRLQQTLADQLEYQAALGERLLDDADQSMGVVKKGNQYLEQAASDSAMRNIVVLVFAILTLLILLLHSLN